MLSSGSLSSVSVHRFPALSGAMWGPGAYALGFQTPKNRWAVEEHRLAKVYFRVPCGSLPRSSTECSMASLVWGGRLGVPLLGGSCLSSEFMCGWTQLRKKLVLPFGFFKACLSLWLASCP